MDWTIILSIALGALMIVAAFVILYFLARYKVLQLIPGAIDFAETTKEKGKEKMKQAIMQIYEKLPAVFKTFITQKTMEKLIQKVFDKMEEYAKKQIEQKTAGVIVKQGENA